LTSANFHIGVQASIFGRICAQMPAMGSPVLSCDISAATPSLIYHFLYVARLGSGVQDTFKKYLEDKR
jgi:hypothetical protein